MSHFPPISPGANKKKPALPFLLSNLRNAQATIAGSVTGTSEARPLVSGSGSSNNDHKGSSYASDRSNMKRSVTASLTSSARSNVDPTPNTRLNANTNPSSLSATLTNLSQRWGETWRKRNKHLHKEDDSLRHNTKKRRQIRVSVPQAFLLSSVCFFFAIPLLVLLYVLARKSVFGDEGGDLSATEHKYEVPAFDANNSMSPEKQSNVLKELEGQFEDVMDVDKTVDLVVDAGEQGIDQSREDESASFRDFDQNVEESKMDSHSNLQSNVSEDNVGNLRGYQQPDDENDKIEFNHVSNEKEHTDLKELEAPQNMALGQDEQVGIVGDNIDAKLPEDGNIDNDKGSV